MKKLILLLISGWLILSVKSQTKKSYKVHPLPAEAKGGNTQCVYHPRYPAAVRRRFYPFRIADTVKLVSFRYHKKSPLRIDSLVMDSLIEVRTLSRAEVDTLTNILYNHFYKAATGFGFMPQCYEPRNGILFFDAHNRFEAFIEICFHFENYRLSSSTIKWGDLCDEKISKLREYFIWKGLRFGTDKQVTAYPGETGQKEEGIVSPDDFIR